MTYHVNEFNEAEGSLAFYLFVRTDIQWVDTSREKTE
jgi:hypothetical protein